MSVEQIWFGTRAVRFEGGGNTGPQIGLLDAAGDFATRSLPGGAVADFTGGEWQQVLAFVGDAAAQQALGVNLADGVDAAVPGQVAGTGDLRVGEGVVAHNIADAGGGGRVMDATGTLDDADDPIALSGFGKASAGSLSGATTESSETGNRVIFSNDLGFGFLGGSGFETNGGATRLNDGDAINFEIKQGRVLVEASFTVKVLNGGSTAVVLDSDGRTVKDLNGELQGGFAQDASTGELSLGALAHGTKVRIDYANEKIFVGGLDFGGDAGGFFAAFAANGQNDLTLGSLVGNAIGWSVDDLVLSTDDGLVEPNAPPVAQGFTGGSGDEDTGIAGQVLASDGNGDALSFTIAAGDGPAFGEVTVDSATGAFLYTPDADRNGADSFTVTISDGNGGIALQLVGIAVAAVNDGPLADAATSRSTDEDEAVSFGIIASDPDGDALIFSIEAGDGATNGHATIDAATGQVTYTPDDDHAGPDGFTVTISDGRGGVATQVVQMVVAPRNDAPTAGGFTGGTGAEDGTILGVVGGSDIDGDTLVFSIEIGDGPAHGGAMIDGGTGAFTSTPVAEFNGQDSFTVTIRDGQGGVVTQLVTIVVDPVNDAPVASGHTGGIGDEDDPIAGAVLASDPDLDALGYSIQAGDGPAHGSVILLGSNGLFWFSPDNDFNGADSFTVTISDGNGGVTTQLVGIIVNPVADPASFSGDTGGAVAEDGTLTAAGVLAVQDADAGEAGFAATGALAGLYGDFAFALATGAWSYTLRNGDVNVQALAGGSMVQDTLEVLSADGSSFTITIAVAGATEPFLPVAITGGGDPNDNPATPSAPVGSYVTYGDGGDSVAGTSGADFINGGDGADTILAGNGSDAVDAGGGDDRVGGSGGNDWLNGGTGADSVSGGTGNDVLIGDTGNDSLSAGSGLATLYGGDGNDLISGSPLIYGGAGADTITGGNGVDDLIFGGSGNDTIRGRGGADTLVGGYGADTLSGGGDADRFVFAGTADTGDIITDFDGAADLLDFSAFAGTLTFKAAAGQSFSANNEIAWYRSGANAIVVVNTDGDAANAEFMVTLLGYAQDVALDDFIL